MNFCVSQRSCRLVLTSEMNASLQIVFFFSLSSEFYVMVCDMQSKSQIIFKAELQTCYFCYFFLIDTFPLRLLLIFSVACL